MSITALHWALGMIAGGRAGSTATKLVLLRLADRADPVGVCWPGHETTARDLDIGQSTVVGAVRWLAINGLLQIERRKDSAGRDLPNRYHLSIDVTPPPARRKLKESPAGDRGVPDAGTRGADRGTGATARAPEPPKNNPKKAEAATAATAAASKKSNHDQKPGAPYQIVDGVRVWRGTDDAARLTQLRATVDVGTFAGIVMRLQEPRLVSHVEAAVAAHLQAEAAVARKAEAMQRATTRAAERELRRAAAPRLDLVAYQSALERAGEHLDEVLRSIYAAKGTPDAWVPSPEWGLSDQDVAAIRAFVPDRRFDE